MNDSALRELADDQSSRKRFFKMLGGAGAVGAASVLIAACGDDDKTGGGAAAGGAAAKTTGDNTSDLEIVNYALTLEFLEATFYQEVLERQGVVEDVDVAVAVLGECPADVRGRRHGAVGGAGGERGAQEERLARDAVDLDGGQLGGHGSRLSHVKSRFLVVVN